MNPYHDLFVGGVSVAIGLVGIVSAACNWNACFELPKLRLIEAGWGRGRARWACGLGGLVFLILGLAAAGGWRIY